MAKISTFDDWVDYFLKWQDDVGLDRKLFGDYEWGTRFGDVASSEIEFGDFAGRPKWETAMQIPDQRIRDSLLHLIVYQGDTEFASTEQQRHLLAQAPSDYDLQAAARVMREEMRHGWQMAYLLIKYFGDTGKLEARKLLERHAYDDTRLLDTFNKPMEHWLDFYCYTALVDRDGKYQLSMLSYSGFKPLASSMGPMLEEEAYHLWTGFMGLSRVLKAAHVPVEIVQKYVNRWFSSALDLFGVDHSSSASWFYVWGLKGRFDEHEANEPADRDMLNDRARKQYRREVVDLVAQLNSDLAEGRPKLYVPDIKFNRTHGEYKGEPYSVTGERLSLADYEKHLVEVLPGPQDRTKLDEIFKDNSWVYPVGQTA